MVYGGKKILLFFFGWCISLGMAERKPIPVRLGDEMISRLDEAAGRIGSNRAAVMRMLIESWLANYEKHGAACLPADWQRIMLNDAPTKAETPERRPVKYPRKK
jgi:hypothetical protein